MRLIEDFDAVRRLIAAGFNDCEVARQTGMPRPTVREWRHRSTRRPRPTDASSCGIDHDFPNLPPAQYAYLLGMYLGDGCISRSRRVWRLRVTLDSKYPGIIESCRQAIDAVLPRQQASVFALSDGSSIVSHYSKHWPCLLPQHGPGRKHLRPIRLEPWQQALVTQATEDFIRGLIDSDGCRVIANDRGVRSVRYHFSNRSEDIHGLFTGALDDLGIPWTRNSRYSTAVYRKAAVARLDEFVGPKDGPRRQFAPDDLPNPIIAC